MNKEEALRLLDQRLSTYRTAGYAALLRLLRDQDTLEVDGFGDTKYQVEIHAVWDDREGGNLRIIGSIDDGRWRAFVPLTSSFIVRPDGTFVGE